MLGLKNGKSVAKHLPYVSLSSIKPFYYVKSGTSKKRSSNLCKVSIPTKVCNCFYESMTSGAYWECRSKVTEQPSSATSANVSELIEMTSFKTVAEGDMELQSGKGHHFQGMSSFNPIW